MSLLDQVSKDAAPEALLALSLQRALLGNITPNMRRVSGELHERTIRLLFLFASPASEEELEIVSCVGAEVIADYPEGYWIEEQAVTLPPSEALRPLTTGCVVFQRRE